MTSNFTAAELRELADRLETRSFDYQPNPFCLHCAAALREYADLKEAAQRGVTDEVIDNALDAWFGPRQAEDWREDVTVGGKDLASCYRADMRAALLAVAPLLALTNKETP